MLRFTCVLNAGATPQPAAGGASRTCRGLASAESAAGRTAPAAEPAPPPAPSGAAGSRSAPAHGSRLVQARGASRSTCYDGVQSIFIVVNIVMLNVTMQRLSKSIIK